MAFEVRRRRIATAAAGAFAVLAAGLVAASGKQIAASASAEAWYASSAFFPRLALGLMLAGALAHLARLLAGARADAGEEIDADSSAPRPALFAVLLFAGYALAALWIGFIAATALFAFVLLLALGWPLRFALIFAAIAAGALYAVFVLALGIWFPAPQLLRWVSGG